MIPAYPVLQSLPYRLGATSYCIPADLAANARYLAGQVRDMELVLFDLDGGPSNLPDAAMLSALRAVAEAGNLTYTVHLPLDLRLEADGDVHHESLVKARRVIDSILALSPWAYVAHLDGREVKNGASASGLRRWQDMAVRVLEIVAGWAGEPENLALENLEGYPLEFLEPVLERSIVSRCVDVGHLWLDGHDPLPYLAQALPRTRIIHLHGLAVGLDGATNRVRDHNTLARMPADAIDAVTTCLNRSTFRGVLTLEVFDERDFQTSLKALAESIERTRQTSKEGKNNDG